MVQRFFKTNQGTLAPKISWGGVAFAPASSTQSKIFAKEISLPTDLGPAV